MKREVETCITADWSEFHDSGETNIYRECFARESGTSRRLHVASIEIRSCHKWNGVLEIAFKEPLGPLPKAKREVESRLRALLSEKVLHSLIGEAIGVRNSRDGYKVEFLVPRGQQFTSVAMGVLRTVLDRFGTHAIAGTVKCVQETFVWEKGDWIAIGEYLRQKFLASF